MESNAVSLDNITDWAGFVAACAAGGVCGRCKGTKITKGMSGEGYNFPDRPCYFCDGKGVLGGFDPLTIVKACFVVKPGKSARFRQSPPSKWSARKRGSDGARAYYVWRMVRFHGGKDVTMPMEAISVCEGDPALPLLDVLVSVVAKRVCGTDRAAAYRWGRLLVDPTLPEYPPGEPLSATTHQPAILEAEMDHEPAE